MGELEANLLLGLSAYQSHFCRRNSAYRHR